MVEGTPVQDAKNLIGDFAEKRHDARGDWEINDAESKELQQLEQKIRDFEASSEAASQALEQAIHDVAEKEHLDSSLFFRLIWGDKVDVLSSITESSAAIAVRYTLNKNIENGKEYVYIEIGDINTNSGK